MDEARYTAEVGRWGPLRARCRWTKPAKNAPTQASHQMSTL